MTISEQTWYIKYMNNLCTYDTLMKLAKAGKLEEIKIVEWQQERLEKYGY